MLYNLLLLTFLIVLSICAVIDYKYQRIPNVCILVLFGLGCLRYLSDLNHVFWGSLLGMICVLMFSVLLYAVGMIGAGDAKLLAVIALFIGIQKLTICFLYIAAFAAGQSIFHMIYHNILRNRIHLLINYIKFIFFFKTVPSYTAFENELEPNSGRGRIPIGVSVLFGTICFLLQKQ